MVSFSHKSRLVVAAFGIVILASMAIFSASGASNANLGRFSANK